jgi:hypothetical protein
LSEHVYSNELIAEWRQRNDEFLSAALAWLRLRLMRLAQRDQAVIVVPSAPAESAANRGPWWNIGGRAGADEPRPAPALPPPSGFVSDEQIAQAADAMERAAAGEPRPALHLLGDQLHLTSFERETLLLCAAIELDTRAAGLCAQAQDDPQRCYPTFALALALFDDPAWDALSPERPLRRWRLIDIHQPAALALTSSALRADERIVNYLKGLNDIDDRLHALLSPLEPRDDLDLPPSQQARADRIVQQLRQASPDRELPVVQLLGGDRLSKQLVARAAAQALDRTVYRLAGEAIPTQPNDLEALARLWQRESLLLPVALYLEAPDAGPDAAAPPIGRFAVRSGGLIFVDTRDLRSDLADRSIVIDVAHPTAAEQRDAWAAALGDQSDGAPDLLAGQFSLNLPTIAEIARQALADDEAQSALPERLWDSCRASLRPQLGALAQRIEPLATWEMLVLPQEERDLLQQIADQVGQRARVYGEWGFAQMMNRGLGISALFAGDSGTGKTMAAEVLANHLRLDLYRIDLSAVVSKYIGETEKNLRTLFDRVEDGGAILFFDEADALFGKRSEVKDSHDRYANIEINYLLQRMEAYRGLAILATNMKSALDTAFLRRLRFIVNFSFPAAAERKAIWQRAFPAETPLDELDYDRLARLNLTGGNIHTIALNAAFRAATAGSAVTMPLLLDAARTELRKLDRVINEADFRWNPAGRARP